MKACDAIRTAYPTLLQDIGLAHPTACHRSSVACIMLMLSAVFLYRPMLAEPLTDDACEAYRKVMAGIPQIDMVVSDAETIERDDGKSYMGCSVRVETRWSLVGDDFAFSSVLELPGWEKAQYVADGPGASVYEMLKTGRFCIVGFDFPSYVDEQTSRLVRGDELRIHARCARSGELIPDRPIVPGAGSDS